VKQKLFRFAFSLLRNEDDAKDMVQDVFLKIWNKKENMHHYHNIEAWCMTMVKNQCLDKLRSKAYKSAKATVHYELKNEQHTPAQRLEVKDTLQKIDRFVSELPEKQRIIWVLRDKEGHSYQEISDIMNIDVNQVKVNIFRARKYLRQKLINEEAYGL